MVTWVWFMRMLFLSFTSIALSVNCLILFINLIKKVEIPEGRLLAFYNGVRLHHTRWKIQKKNLQPRYMWQIFVRHFFALDKARKTTNNCIQPHKVLKKTNNCIQPRNICMPIVIRIHELTTETILYLYHIYNKSFGRERQGDTSDYRCELRPGHYLIIKVKICLTVSKYGGLLWMCWMVFR